MVGSVRACGVFLPEVLSMHRLALALAIAIAATLVAAESRAQQSTLYPTDACVAAKLDAAAAYCARSIRSAGRGGKPLLASARQRLVDAWADAESTSSAAGVSCSETTATAQEMLDTIDRGAATLVSQIADRTKRGHGRESRSYQAAALACSRLLAFEADHLRTRDTDRTRATLDARNAKFERRWRNDHGHACKRPSAGRVFSLAEDLVDDVLYASYVSPRVSTDWTMITPDAEIPYEGKTLDPICSRGTPWVFFVKRGTVNKTLMYYQGGGACWSHTTCTFPTHKVSASASDNPANSSSGFADLDNPENPFKDWNAVFVPYCTGDVHWGDEVVEHRQGGLRVTIHHKGFVNAQVAEKWAREHFANPEQVFVTGSSAGAYGAIMNSLPLQEKVWPSSDFAVLGDAGNGVITDDFLQNDLSKWGIEKNLPSWIPGLDVPITELDASRLWSIPANFYPHNRYANYTSAYDGGQGGQTGFYNIMLNLSNPFAWLNWWPPSCEWNAIMREYSFASAAAAANYRYYIGSGSRHTMWANDKVYDDTTGNVPPIVDWVQAMLDGTPDWVNVETDDPGLLLPGDPRPVPPEYPYTEDDRIVCE